MVLNSTRSLQFTVWRTHLVLVVSLLTLHQGTAACAPNREVSLEGRDHRYEHCAVRAKGHLDGSGTSIAGIIRDLRDDTDVDGEVRLVLIRGDGSPAKAVFGSLYTRPPPSEERKAVYERIRASREGDCVVISGTEFRNRHLWITKYVSLDRP